MPTKKKNPALPLFLLANFLLILIYFVPYYIMELKNGADILGYVISHIQEALIWLLAPLGAAFMLIAFANGGMSSALKSCLSLSLTSLVYTIPYYYLIGVSYGLNSIESLIFSPCISIIYILVFYMHLIILFLVGKAAFARSLKKEIIASLPPAKRESPDKNELSRAVFELMGDRVHEGGAFDLESPITLSFFFIAFAEFSLHLVSEIYDTVVYLTSFAGDYRGFEIGYIFFRFVFILGMLFVSWGTLAAAKKISKKEAKEIAEGKKIQDAEEEKSE